MYPKNHHCLLTHGGSLSAEQAARTMAKIPNGRTLMKKAIPSSITNVADHCISFGVSERIDEVLAPRAGALSVLKREIIVLCLVVTRVLSGDRFESIACSS